MLPPKVPEENLSCHFQLPVAMGIRWFGVASPPVSASVFMLSSPLCVSLVRTHMIAFRAHA